VHKAERVSQNVDSRLSLQGSPDQNTRQLRPEGVRGQAAADDVETAVHLACPVRGDQVEAHVADDAREKQAPFVPGRRPAIDRDLASGWLENAPSKGQAEERTHEHARRDPCGGREPLPRGLVVGVEEACDQPGAEDEPHAFAAAVVSHT
jgi:hypothetical protein